MGRWTDDAMSLTEWMKTVYGTEVRFSGGACGAQLAAEFYRSLVDAGYDYQAQKRLLYDACGIHHDLAFGNACLDFIASIEDFEQRRGSLKVMPVRKCHSGVPKNKDWAPGAEYAELRFAAARTVGADLLDALDDMVDRMVGEGCIESRPDIRRDLRQDLGYYRPDEDIVRRRRTVKWLRGQNALHYWIASMLGGRDPLIRVADGAPGCWVTAASLFIDRQGRAFTYSRLEHGRLSNEKQETWLRGIIPLSPSSHLALRAEIL